MPAEYVLGVFDVETPATMAAWIATQKSGNKASKVIATGQYFVGNVQKAVVVMATNITAGSGTLAAVSSSTFNITNGTTALATWLNAQYTASPSLSYLQSFRVYQKGNRVLANAVVSN